MLLEYEKEILENTCENSFLIIGSQGLELNTILKLTIQLYCNKYSLVFLINFGDILPLGQNDHLKIIKDVDKKTRQKMYFKGGVFVCSDRVLLIDFLENNVPVDRICSLIVKNADKIKENSLDAFILHIYKQKNKKGYVKAFSTNCTPFAYGINSLEKYIKTIGTNNLILYPRFHESVERSLNKEVKFIQYNFKLPEVILEIQMILVEILKETLSNNKIDVEYELILVSNAYMNNHVKDVNDLKYLINLLFSCNLLKICTECMKFINEQIDLGKDSTWLNCRYTIILIEKIEHLIAKYAEDTSVESVSILDKSFEFFKKQKKFKKEKKNENFAETGKYNLKYLKLINLLKTQNFKNKIVIFETRVKKLDIEFQLQKNESYILNSVKFITKKEFLDSEIINDNIQLKDNFNCINKFVNESSGIKEVYTYDNSTRIISKAEEFEPYCIILYDLDIALIRKCEYIGTKNKIEVISFMFKDSLEEQRYLNSIRREKYNFELLIEIRGKVAVNLDKIENLLEEESSEDEHRNYIIIVDSRELRAELPFSLYKGGNTLIIDTLSIGDYLINECICIERKSISDLISSLSSGRLYSQACTFTYKYNNPLLLIEFNSRPCLSDFYKYLIDNFRNSLVSKLCLFLISFPTVRLLWSESSLNSTKMFRHLQKKESVNIENHSKVEIDPILQEILFSLPGVNQFNVKKIIKNYKNLKEMIQSSKENLRHKIGNDCGILLYNFFNSNFSKNDLEK